MEWSKLEFVKYIQDIWLEKPWGLNDNITFYLALSDVTPNFNIIT